MHVFWLSLLDCIQGNKINDFFNSLEADSAVLNPEADGKAPLKTDEEKAIEQVTVLFMQFC